MRLVLASLTALLTAACMSTGKPVATMHAVLAVDDAKGLTRAAFAEQLGIAGPQNALVLSAELVDGAVVTVVSNASLTGNARCGDNGDLRLLMWHGEPTDADDLGDLDQLSPPAIFRDGRYEGPMIDRVRPGEDANEPAYIVAACSQQRMGFSLTPVVMAPVAATYVAFTESGKAVSAAIAAGHMIGHDINAILATLPLGAEPPGGLDAWLADLPVAAVLVERQGDTVVVVMHAETPADPDSDSPYAETFRANRMTRWDVKVTFKAGRVSRLEPDTFFECELLPSRAVRCRKRDLG